VFENSSDVVMFWGQYTGENILSSLEAVYFGCYVYIRWMNRNGPRTEPCGTSQVSGYDRDDASDVLTEKVRDEIYD